MNRPDLCAIAQAALHEVVIARLIIAMCEGPFCKPIIMGPEPDGGREDVMPCRPGEKPGPGHVVLSFSVRPEVTEKIKEFCVRRTS